MLTITSYSVCVVYTYRSNISMSTDIVVMATRYEYHNVILN